MQSFWGNLVDQVAFVNYVPWENVYDSKEIHVASPCSDLWRRMYVWWDDVAHPCEVDFKSSLTVGKIHTNDIGSLWTSSACENLRKKHRRNLTLDIKPQNACVGI